MSDLLHFSKFRVCQTCYIQSVRVLPSKQTFALSSPILHTLVYIPYPRERGPTTECRPTTHFELNFLLRSSVYSMHLCVAASSNGWFMRTELQIAKLASFMPRFSTNQRLYTASDRSHAHLLQLHSGLVALLEW